MIGTVEERLKARLTIDPNGCWIWMGCASGGYGYIKIKGKMKLVHRVAWELANGPIPKGVFVCHHCDTPSCANLEHLFLGTHTDNMKDMTAKGRQCKTNWNTDKTHCKHGHSFNEDNTYRYVYNGKERRQCRICHNKRDARYQAKRKANE